MTGLIEERDVVSRSRTSIAELSRRRTADRPGSDRAPRLGMLVVYLSDPDRSVDSTRGATTRDQAPAMNAIAFATIGDGALLDVTPVAAPSAAAAGAPSSSDLALVVREALEHAIEIARTSGVLTPPATPEFDWRQPLTKRERDVLQLVAQGYSNQRVARTLWLSEKTVKFHLGRIFRKLNVTNRTEATCWAYRSGLVNEAALAS